MLEFIILGQVPGTSVQITFNWVLSAALVMLTFGHLAYRIKRSTKTDDNSDYFDQIAL